MYKMKSESILIGELREGSQTAFKCIYDLYVGRLYSFALSYCKSRENTQELVEILLCGSGITEIVSKRLIVCSPYCL